MANTLTLDQIDAANRAMSSLTVGGINNVIICLLAFAALMWAGLVVYGFANGVTNRDIDFFDAVVKTTLVFVILIITGLFILLI